MLEQLNMMLDELVVPAIFKQKKEMGIDRIKGLAITQSPSTITAVILHGRSMTTGKVNRH